MKSTHPLAVLSLAALLLGTGMPALAGEGHDHGEAPAASAGPAMMAYPGMAIAHSGGKDAAARASMDGFTASQETGITVRPAAQAIPGTQKTKSSQSRCQQLL